MTSRSASIGRIIAALGVIVWTLIPIYHMLVMGFTRQEEAVSGALFPAAPTLENFRMALMQDHPFLRNFWSHLGNSVLVAICVPTLVLVISSLASFSVGRLRVRGGSWVMNLALLTYLVPAAFLAVPMYQTMATYGVLNTHLSLMLALTTFATPYGIWVITQYARSIPYELDEAARIDGASALQLFWMVYLPLLAPALVTVGTYALLMAWNEYLYAFLLLSGDRQLTVPAALGLFLTSDEAPWNLLMATAAIYSLPPAAVYFALRRYMTAGLLTGAVKG